MSITPKERRILFSAPMVRAILDGSKTQTRRVVKPQPDEDGLARLVATGEWHDTDARVYRCPYGAPGDRLWVGESFARVPSTAYRCSTGVQQTVDPGDPDMCVVYREGWERSRPGGWRPSIFMPRWASRILLEITDVRVQRLQDISDLDIEAEGVQPANGWLQFAHRKAWMDLWQSIHGAGSWDANSWVWAITFRRLQP